MPLTFLTNQERKLYEQIPMIDEVEMRQHFYLTQSNKIFISTFNGALNRISVAVQLCLLRYLGYVPNYRSKLRVCKIRNCLERWTQCPPFVKLSICKI